MTLSVFPGTYNGRNEDSNIDWPASIDAISAEGVILQNNVVAGSERVAYLVAGESCYDVPEAENEWKNNKAHGVLIGVKAAFELQCAEDCARFSGFSVFRSYGYGFYSQTVCSVILENSVLVENKVGFFPMVFEPASDKHETEDKFTIIRNSLLVGETEHYDECGSEWIDDKARPNIDLASNGLAFTSPVTEGHIAISWPLLNSHGNLAPLMRFHLSKAHVSLYGHMKASGKRRKAIFIHFTCHCFFYT